MNKNQLVAAILAFAAVASLLAEDALRALKNDELQTQLDGLIAAHPDTAEAAYAAAEAKGWKRPASLRPDEPSPPPPPPPPVEPEPETSTVAETETSTVAETETSTVAETETSTVAETATDSPLLAPAIAYIAAGKYQVEVASRNDKGELEVTPAAHSGEVQIAEFTTRKGKNGKPVTHGRQTPETIVRAHVTAHREYEDRIVLLTCDGQRFTVERAVL